MTVVVSPRPSVTGVTGEGNGLIEGPCIWAREASEVSGTFDTYLRSMRAAGQFAGRTRDA